MGMCPRRCSASALGGRRPPSRCNEDADECRTCLRTLGHAVLRFHGRMHKAMRGRRRMLKLVAVGTVTSSQRRPHQSPPASRDVTTARPASPVSMVRRSPVESARGASPCSGRQLPDPGEIAGGDDRQAAVVDGQRRAGGISSSLHADRNQTGTGECIRAFMKPYAWAQRWPTPSRPRGRSAGSASRAAWPAHARRSRLLQPCRRDRPDRARRRHAVVGALHGIRRCRHR